MLFIQGLTHFHWQHSWRSRNAIPTWRHSWKHSEAGQCLCRKPTANTQTETPRPQHSQPSSSHKFCLPNAVTGSLQRCFSDVILDSELTLCKSGITLGTQTAAYQPFLSSHKYLPLFVTSWTNLLLTSLTHLPPPTLFPLVFLCPSSPATTLHLPMARRASHEPQTALPERPAPAPHQHPACCALWRQPVLHKQQIIATKSPAAWDSSYDRDEGQYIQHLSSVWASKIFAFGYLQNECNM